MIPKLPPSGFYSAFRYSLMILSLFLTFPLYSIDDDGSGCTDPNACNYDPTATVDDGSCFYDTCFGVVNDDYCFNDGDLPNYNVLANDNLPDGYILIPQGNDPCVFIDPVGNIRLTGNTDVDCCGEHPLFYSVITQDGSAGWDAQVLVTIKCEAPNCEIIDLSALIGGTDGAGGEPQGGTECIHVCEHSVTTFTYPFSPTETLLWDVPFGGAGNPGVNPGEYIVTWGSAGTGVVSLTVISNGVPTEYTFCIDIMAGPPAFFTGPTNLCLSQTASFNAASGADEYHWDFGDASFGTGQFVTHTYTTAGTYNVTLTTVGYNYDAEGNPLCSCENTYTMQVVVEDLPGPDILWVSTLCEGDSTKYWTTANCTGYTWTVTDAFGNNVLFEGANNDTICVTWPAGAGPFGTISLAVTGCTPQYCTYPTTVTIPIIPSSTSVEGPTVVCEGETAVYTLPKWVSTTYNWTVTGNGTIMSGNGGHQIVVMWGSAGVGHVHVDYYSDFLAGLPGHEDDDCYGTADLDVSILPQFALSHFSGNTVCLNSTTTFSATSFPLNTYSWSVPAPNTYVQTSPNTIDVTWTAPGIYVIKATPTNSGFYCNDEESIVVRVVEVPAPTGIDGAVSICLNTPYTYSAVGAPGMSYQWNVSTGGVITGFGQTVTVQWTTPGPHWLSVNAIQFAPVYCISDPFVLNITDKTLPASMAISGGALCSNSVEQYVLSPLPDPEAVINWTVFPTIAGSVIAGQGTGNVDVQWNNYSGPVTLTATVSLCGQTVPVDFNGTIHIPVVPVIQQVGNLCPGVTATLQTTQPFTSYSWSPGGQTTPTISISTAGSYSVTTVDANGCTATGYFTANNIDGPTANITSGDDPDICYAFPHNVTMVTPTNGFYQYEWYCNGGLVSGPNGVSTYTHTFVGNPLVQNYFYQVFVTDLNTGCEKWSLMFLVTESPDCPGDCTPEPFVCNIQSIPNCNQGTFTAVGSNFTVVQWSFGDTNFGGGNPASHVYLAAGCYNVQLTIAVPNIIPGEPDCLITIDDSICIPLGVDFDIDYVGCGQIDFTDLSSWIAGPGNAITSYSWNFGDGSPLGSGTTPSHTYANPGVYNVTLTVTNGNGCVSSISHPVTITSVGVPTLTYSPATVCVGEPVSFSSVATSAVTYTWNFGDGATFVGPSPSHTYTSVPMGGSATVTVTAQDADGCTKTSQVTFPVNPSPSGAITGPTTICQGDLATLTAPSGYAYQWVPGGQTTQTINVGGGTYSVILTNGFGCSIETAEVMVEEIPKPQVNISGNLIICDNGCTTLFATYGDGWSYTWYDDVNNVVGFGPSLTVCSGSLANNYKVEVVNAFGCIGNAGPVAVTVAASPVYTVLVNGTLCEGDPTVLTVTPNLPNWTYTWSSGGNGPVTTVSALGNHTVVVTDIDSGCSSSHTETVNPKPDFCAVPSGCYTSCFGDEVCGDPGMVSYQWNFNGTPITGETGQCIFVMQSGVYTVTETNSFGCTDTSGPIVFELVDCSSNPCDSLFVEYAYLVDPVTNETDSCCVTLSYTNNYGPVLGLSITSSDADLVFSNISSSLQIQSILPNGIELGSIIPTTSIPQGVLNNVATFCLTDVINNPQEVVIHWYDMDASIICPDTLIFNCPVEPDCLYLTNDTIYCDGVETLYEFTVCNPNDADWAVSYISLVPTSPTGIVLSPSAIDLTANPLQPGDCATFTLSLSGAGIEGQTFCYNMVAHIDNPDLHPDALCCSLDTTYCIDIPFCDPCGFVDAFAEPLNEEDCCYNIVLNNGYNPNYFDAIDLCVISPQTTFTLNNPFGSGWTTSGYNGTVATLLPTGFGNFVPGGTSVLPELCIDTYVAPNQLIEVKWMHEGEVVCRDTLSFFCEPDCGYFTHDLVTCNDDGTWTFSADLVNNTGYAIGEAVISFAGALSVYNNSITLGNVPNGGVFSPIVFNIGAPAQPGDEICFTVTLHEINSDGIYLNCCNFTYCMILPDCGFTPPCACDEAFLNAGSAGMSCTANSALLYEYSFDLLSNLIQESCDQVRWNVTGIPGVTVLPGGAPFVYNFPAPGSYQVCARVYRTLPDGTTCKFMVCKDVVVLAVANITVYPNPGQGLFYVAMPKAIDDLTKFTVMDNVGRPVLDARLSRTESNVVELDLRSAAPGVYMLECVVDGRREVHKIVIQ